MSLAAIAWIVLACVIVLAIVLTIIIMIPEIRRYLRMKEM
jgi:hypothetical protein